MFLETIKIYTNCIIYCLIVAFIFYCMSYVHCVSCSKLPALHCFAATVAWAEWKSEKVATGYQYYIVRHHHSQWKYTRIKLSFDQDFTKNNQSCPIAFSVSQRESLKLYGFEDMGWGITELHAKSIKTGWFIEEDVPHQFCQPRGGVVVNQYWQLLLATKKGGLFKNPPNQAWEFVTADYKDDVRMLHTIIVAEFVYFCSASSSI